MHGYWCAAVSALILAATALLVAVVGYNRAGVATNLHRDTYTANIVNNMDALISVQMKVAGKYKTSPMELEPSTKTIDPFGTIVVGKNDSNQADIHIESVALPPGQSTSDSLIPIKIKLHNRGSKSVSVKAIDFTCNGIESPESVPDLFPYFGPFFYSDGTDHVISAGNSVEILCAVYVREGLDSISITSPEKLYVKFELVLHLSNSLMVTLEQQE